MEKELFAVFLESAQDCLAALKANTSDAAREAWRSQAHAFKGISYNLGAEPLGDLCREAQDNPAMTVEEKTALLAKIEAEYKSVQEFLAQLA